MRAGDESRSAVRRAASKSTERKRVADNVPPAKLVDQLWSVTRDATTMEVTDHIALTPPLAPTLEDVVWRNARHLMIAPLVQWIWETVSFPTSIASNWMSRPGMLLNTQPPVPVPGLQGILPTRLQKIEEDQIRLSTTGQAVEAMLRKLYTLSAPPTIKYSVVQTSRLARESGLLKNVHRCPMFRQKQTLLSPHLALVPTQAARHLQQNLFY